MFSHRNSNPDILLNAWQILEDRITIKARKCAPLAGERPLWLALLNDYWLADSHTYKDALSRFSLIHHFDKILLVNGGGTVELLYSAD